MQRINPASLPAVFVKFSCDLVSYGLLQILDEHWESPYLEFNDMPFDEVVGLAAVVFRQRHEDEFCNDIDEHPEYILQDVDTVLKYLRQFITKNFKGNVPLMEFIVYCAFLVHLSVCCFEEDKAEYISEIVEETFDVYEQHIKPYFHAIGGWKAITQMAEQYLGFVKSMRKYTDMVKKQTARDSARVSAVRHREDHLPASAHSADGNASTDSRVEVTPATKTARDSHAGSSSIEHRTQRNSHANYPHATGSAGGNDCTGDSTTMDVGSNDKESDMNDSACSRVLASVLNVASATGSTNSRATDAIGGDSSEGVSNPDASDDDSHVDYHSQAAASNRASYFHRDGEGKGFHARVTATTSARETTSAGDCNVASESESETSSYPPVVYMRNGLVIPSTVTSEYALTESEDINSMVKEDMHF